MTAHDAQDQLPGDGGREPEKIEPLALVISLLPLIGLAGGAIALARHKPRNGLLMMAIGFTSLLMLSSLR